MFAVGTYRIADKQIIRQILAYQNIILVFFILGKLAFFTPKAVPRAQAPGINHKFIKPKRFLKDFFHVAQHRHFQTHRHQVLEVILRYALVCAGYFALQSQHFYNLVFGQRRVTAQNHFHLLKRPRNAQENIIAPEACSSIKVYRRQHIAGHRPCHRSIVNFKRRAQIGYGSLIHLNVSVYISIHCTAGNMQSSGKPQIVQIFVVKMNIRPKCYLNIQPVVAAAFGKLRYRRHIDKHVIQTDICLNMRAVANAAAADAFFRIGADKIALRNNARRTVNAPGENFRSNFRIFKDGVDDIGFIFLCAQGIVAGSSYRAFAHLHRKFIQLNVVACKVNVKINIVKYRIRILQFHRAAVKSYFAVNKRFFQRTGQSYLPKGFANAPLNHRG